MVDRGLLRSAAHWQPEMRADAERNRRAILAAAKMALEESDAVTMQSIAKLAGVGQGTLYRHFPTRDDLLLTLYRDEFDVLLHHAIAIEKDETDPLAAIRRWLNELAEFGRTKRILANLLSSTIRGELHDEQLGPISRTIGELLAAGQQKNLVRADITAHDVLTLATFLWALDPTPEARRAHLLDLLVDALTL